MLIDSFLPQFDFNEIHSIEIDAPAKAAYDTVFTTDIAGSRIVRALMGIRSIPSFLSGRRKFRTPERMTLRDARRAGFGLLGEDPPHEAVLGIEGKFWKLRPDVCAVDAATFTKPVPEGLARAAWNFCVSPLGESRSRLTTETRILCGDPQTRRTFGWYWTVVQPGSALIRLSLLRQIAREARRIDLA